MLGTNCHQSLCQLLPPSDRRNSRTLFLSLPESKLARCLLTLLLCGITPPIHLFHRLVRHYGTLNSSIVPGPNFASVGGGQKLHSLLRLAVARLPHLIEKRLCAGIDGKITQIDRLLALQIHDDHFSAVVVKGEA